MTSHNRKLANPPKTTDKKPAPLKPLTSNKNKLVLDKNAASLKPLSLFAPPKTSEESKSIINFKFILMLLKKIILNDNSSKCRSMWVSKLEKNPPDNMQNLIELLNKDVDDKNAKEILEKISKLNLQTDHKMRQKLFDAFKKIDVTQSPDSIDKNLVIYFRDEINKPILDDLIDTFVDDYFPKNKKPSASKYG